MTFFSHRPQHTGYPRKLTTRILPALKSLALPGGGLTTYTSKLCPQNLSVLALGVHVTVHLMHPWLRLWRRQRDYTTIR